MSDMNVTIYDIAKKCHVSIATVSRVLNGNSRVSEKTRRIVLDAIKDMGYTPNPFARGLGLDSMKIVGVLCTSLTDAFFARAVSLIEDGMRQHHFDIMLSCTGPNTGHNSPYITGLVNKHVDGLITVGTVFSSEPDIAALTAAAGKIPVLTINCDYHQPGIYSIVCNEAEGMRRLVHTLARQHCRHIAYLYDVRTYSGRHKLQGLRQGLKELGIKENPALIQQVSPNLEGAEKAIENLVSRNVPFDAIVTSEDILAVGAQRAALENGRYVPVIGWNNSILATCATPTLSSIDNRLDSLCASAVQSMTQLLSGQDQPVPVRTEFSAILVERESFQTKKE